MRQNDEEILNDLYNLIRDTRMGTSRILEDKKCLRKG